MRYLKKDANKKTSRIVFLSLILISAIFLGYSVPLVGAYCGDGIIDHGEKCDGSELGGVSCTFYLRYESGTLGCKSDCSYDTSGCVNPIGWIDMSLKLSSPGVVLYRPFRIDLILDPVNKDSMDIWSVGAILTWDPTELN